MPGKMGKMPGRRPRKPMGKPRGPHPMKFRKPPLPGHRPRAGCIGVLLFGAVIVSGGLFLI